jgi:hypothetical protein
VNCLSTLTEGIQFCVTLPCKDRFGSSAPSAIFTWEVATSTLYWALTMFGCCDVPASIEAGWVAGEKRSTGLAAVKRPGLTPTTWR